jgi:hypothetical protein
LAAGVYFFFALRLMCCAGVLKLPEAYRPVVAGSSEAGSSEVSEGRIVRRFSSGIYPYITAGLVSAGIYLIIALTTGGPAGSAIWMAALLGVVTSVIAFLITEVILRVRRRAG